jgi:hypothetical protein
MMFHERIEIVDAVMAILCISITVSTMSLLGKSTLSLSFFLCSALTERCPGRYGLGHHQGGLLRQSLRAVREARGQGLPAAALLQGEAGEGPRAARTTSCPTTTTSSSPCPSCCDTSHCLPPREQASHRKDGGQLVSCSTSSCCCTAVAEEASPRERGRGRFVSEEIEAARPAHSSCRQIVAGAACSGAGQRLRSAQGSSVRSFTADSPSSSGNDYQAAGGIIRPGRGRASDASVLLRARRG